MLRLFLSLFVPHLSFLCDTSGRPCFVIVAFPGYLHLYLCLTEAPPICSYNMCSCKSYVKMCFTKAC